MVLLLPVDGHTHLLQPLLRTTHRRYGSVCPQHTDVYQEHKLGGTLIADSTLLGAPRDNAGQTSTRAKMYEAEV